MTELRHDNGNIIENENLSVSLDTFHDRRNGFMFQTNPLGALREQAFTDEVNINSNWNTIWQVTERAIRRRLDGRNGDSLQVASLSRSRASSVGNQLSTNGQMEE